MRQENENVVESAELVMLCVELVEGCLQRPVRIPYSTFDGTAQSTLLLHYVIKSHPRMSTQQYFPCDTDGTDYESSEGYLMFEEVSNSGSVQCATVPIVNDEVKEDNESFIFVISAGGDSDVVLEKSSTDVSIIDNDGMSPPLAPNKRPVFHTYTLGVQVSISVMNGGVVDESIGAVPVLVILTGELDRDVTVQIETVEGTGIHSSTHSGKEYLVFFLSSGCGHRLYTSYP